MVKIVSWRFPVVQRTDFLRKRCLFCFLQSWLLGTISSIICAVASTVVFSKSLSSCGWRILAPHCYWVAIDLVKLAMSALQALWFSYYRAYVCHHTSSQTNRPGLSGKKLQWRRWIWSQGISIICTRGPLKYCSSRNPWTLLQKPVLDFDLQVFPTPLCRSRISFPTINSISCSFLVVFHQRFHISHNKDTAKSRFLLFVYSCSRALSVRLPLNFLDPFWVLVRGCYQHDAM